MSKGNSKKQLKELFIEDLGKVTGGVISVTTLALGEEDETTVSIGLGGGEEPPTTVSIGIGGGEEPPTTVAIGVGEDQGGTLGFISN